MAMFCRNALIKNKPAIDLADIGRSLKKIVMNITLLPALKSTGRPQLSGRPLLWDSVYL